MLDNTFIIYTDGSCIDNGLPTAVASWSYVVTNSNDDILEACTGRIVGKQDSNRAELTAFVKALQYIRNQRGVQFIIRTDYEALYLYWQGISKPKANMDLYRQIDYLFNILHDRVTVEKIQGHKSHQSIPNFINGLVDRLAKKCVEIFSGNAV